MYVDMYMEVSSVVRATGMVWGTGTGTGHCIKMSAGKQDSFEIRYRKYHNGLVVRGSLRVVGAAGQEVAVFASGCGGVGPVSHLEPVKQPERLVFWL